MSQPQHPAQASRASNRRWFALVVIAASQLMIVLDATIVNVALPSIKADLGLSLAARQWVITAYTLTFGGLLLLGGRIADYTGRKRAFLVGLLGFAAASAVGGAASSVAMLLAARAVQGAFAALLGPAALSLLTTTFTEPNERSKAFAVFGAVVGSGSAVGLILGGVLTRYLSWHWVLYVNVPIAVAAALGAAWSLRESSAQRRSRYDIPGAVLATGGLVALVYGFTTATDVGWSAGTTVGLLAGGAVLMVAFLAVEARTHSPLLPLTILAHRGRGGAYLVTLLTFAGLFAVFLFVSFYLQRIHGYSALQTGLAFLPMAGGTIVTAGLISRLMARVPPRYLLAAGLFLATAGMALLTRVDLTSSYSADLLPALIMVGLGLGAVFPPTTDLATSHIPSEHAGAASATLNVANQVGASLGTALLNTIAATATAAYLASHQPGPRVRPEALLQGYTTAFTWGAGILAAAGLIALLMINTRPGRTTDQETCS